MENNKKPQRFLHYLIFVVLILSSVIGINALWGLLFIGWTIPALRNRHVFFIDMISRDQAPLFYWAVMIAWVISGVLMLVADLPIIMRYVAG